MICFICRLEKLKEIYQEENEAVMKFIIETYVECLKNTTHGKGL